MDIGTTENLILNMLGGDDNFSATGNLAALIVTPVNGGDGNDNILGTNGADTLTGGAGNDFIDGQQGNDTQFGDDGNEPSSGIPATAATSSRAARRRQARVQWQRRRRNHGHRPERRPCPILTRNLGNIIMDIDETEDIEINAFGGIDSVTGANGLVAAGLLRMRIDGGDGIDTLTGGDTDDTIFGGLLGDTLNGGDGNDTLTGGDANDTMNGGNGDDTMIWNPGDDNDILNGEAGDDTMLFNGANVDEIITITAAAPRVMFTRDVGRGDHGRRHDRDAAVQRPRRRRHRQRRRQPRGADDGVAGSRRGQRRAQHGGVEQGDRRWRRGRRHAELQRGESADPDDAELRFPWAACCWSITSTSRPWRIRTRWAPSRR